MRKYLFSFLLQSYFFHLFLFSVQFRLFHADNVHRNIQIHICIFEFKESYVVNETNVQLRISYYIMKGKLTEKPKDSHLTEELMTLKTPIR